MGAQRWSFHPDDAVNLTELDPDGRHAYQGPYDFILAADHDRIVAEAWADGARTALQWDWGHYVACAVLDGGTCDCEIKGEIEESVAALRKPEVEG